MKLTQDNIQFIDDYLIKKGITYWDIRMEIVDHIASEVEEHLGDKNFEIAFETSIEKLRWEKGYLKDIQTIRLKAINKKIRRQYFKEFANIFKQVRTFLISVLAILLYVFIYNNMSFSFFKVFSIALFSIPPIIYLLNFFLTFLKKAHKSGSLLYSSFYVFFAFLMLQVFIQWFKPEGLFEVSQNTQKIIIFCVTVVNSLFTYAGLKVYLKTLKHTQLIYNKLYPK